MKIILCAWWRMVKSWYLGGGHRPLPVGCWHLPRELIFKWKVKSQKKKSGLFQISLLLTFWNFIQIFFIFFLIIKIKDIFLSWNYLLQYTQNYSTVLTINSEDVQFQSICLPACLWGLPEVCYLAWAWFGKQDIYQLFGIARKYHMFQDKNTPTFSYLQIVSCYGLLSPDNILDPKPTGQQITLPF